MHSRLSFPLILMGSVFLASFLVNRSGADLIGVVSDSDVTFISADCETPLGSYQIEVDVAGERASMLAPIKQVDSLASDETLTINGVDIMLNAGLSRFGVQQRINDSFDQTGVFADDFQGGTRLYSDGFGTDETLTVISDLASSTNSSGFGTSLLNATGVDIEGSIGGVFQVGEGAELDAMGIRLLINDETLLLTTGNGNQGTVTLFEAVPEPGSSSWLLIGLSVLLLPRNRPSRRGC